MADCEHAVQKSEDDVPPLEDMSELLEQVTALRESHGFKKPASETTTSPVVSNGTKQDNQQSGNPTKSKEIPPTSTTSVPSPAATSKNPEKSRKKDAGFGGMKKGFLFGPPAKKSVQPKPKPKTDSASKDSKKDKSSGDADIPYIKPQDPAAKEREHEIAEVQDAMAAQQSMLENKEWVTEKLLDQVMKNEKVAKRIRDPVFIQAIAEFQTNPEQAMIKHQNNADIQEFYKEFCGLLGGHFSELAESQPNPDPASQIRTQDQGSFIQEHDPEQEKINQILMDPEMQKILRDPDVQNMFEALKEDPVKGQSLMQNATPTMRGYIRKLVDAGLLQVQR